MMWVHKLSMPLIYKIPAQLKALLFLHIAYNDHSHITHQPLATGRKTDMQRGKRKHDTSVDGSNKNDDSIARQCIIKLCDRSVLSFLPVKDIARASALSTDWREYSISQIKRRSDRWLKETKMKRRYCKT